MLNEHIEVKSRCGFGKIIILITALASVCFAQGGRGRGSFGAGLSSYTPTDGYILVADGTEFDSVAFSGDGTLNSAGVFDLTCIADVANGDDTNVPTCDNVYDWGTATFQPLESTLTDIADGTIAENLVNTANPWADNEVANDITCSNYLPLAGGTLSGNITVSGGADPGAKYFAVSNLGGQTRMGTSSNYGTDVLGAGTVYASVFGSVGAQPAEIHTNSTLRLSVGSDGTFDFKDNSLTNVGDIVCDDIVSDADSDVVLSPFAAVSKTIDFDAGGTTDFVCDNSQANATEQPIDLGELIPAGCVIISATIECDETVAGSGSAVMTVTAGTTTGATNLLSAKDIDTDGDSSSLAAGTWPVVATQAAAQHVWVNFTPTANWNTLSAGQWSVDVLYYDRAAVRAQKGL
jgi:hypothetical protein